MDSFRLNFVAVGPQRTATSWLYRALSDHSEVALPLATKETYFFDTKFDRGWDWYATHFDNSVPDRTFGEIAPTYFESGLATARLAQAYPELKVLISVRNPIARTYSLLLHEYAKGRLDENFLSAMDADARLARSGGYSVHSPRWEAAFRPENIRYIMQDEIEVDPAAQFTKICRFIGVTPRLLPQELSNRHGQRMLPRSRTMARVAAKTASALRTKGFHNLVETGKKLGLKRIYQGGNIKKVALTRPLFERLLETHEPDIRFLEKRLDRDFSQWRDFSALARETSG